MLLPPDEVELFYKLYGSLLHFVNQRLAVVAQFSDPAEYGVLPPDDRLAIRTKLLEQFHLLDAFVTENPYRLTEDELSIVSSWRHHVKGTFVVFRQLSKYMVFLGPAGEPVAYAVAGLHDPITDLLFAPLPVWADALLLPFRGRIIYDGILLGHNITFGGGIKRMFNDTYRQAKQRGIITTLPTAASATAKPAPPSRASRRTAPKRAATQRPVFQFKITLQNTKPPIWRRIQVADGTLDQLHHHIQAAMGWTNTHLYQFEIDHCYYSAAPDWDDDFNEMDDEDAEAIKISEIVPAGVRKYRFQYEYDFGDGWRHEILFEGLREAEPDGKYPRCVEGKRACPPEDCGGPWGYQRLLETLADPRHPEHDEMLEWAGPIDPEAFSATHATQVMQIWSKRR